MPEQQVHARLLLAQLGECFCHVILEGSPLEVAAADEDDQFELLDVVRLHAPVHGNVAGQCGLAVAGVALHQDAVAPVVGEMAALFEYFLDIKLLGETRITINIVFISHSDLLLSHLNFLPELVEIKCKTAMFLLPYVSSRGSLLYYKLHTKVLGNTCIQLCI